MATHARLLLVCLAVAVAGVHGECHNRTAGRFTCPQPGQEAHFTGCCGKSNEEHCCSIYELTTVRVGITFGVIFAIVVMVAIGYTIQIFRACDRCYHECPICVSDSDSQEFQWDTRWYSVSHEGNRYGVTFHSQQFAKAFMSKLEIRYGRWNTANMLKINKDGQDFVVLNIFFHDLFTPWFYTQGPIKNDEEWIRSDFSEICREVQSELAVTRNWYCCAKKKKKEANEAEAQRLKVKTISSPVRPSLKPWTKFSPGDKAHEDYQTVPPVESERKHSGITMIICEDMVESNGLEKGVQTRQEIKQK